jgi:hypothetical protein
LQATYTWSRNLGQAPAEGANGTGSIFTDPADRGGDYTLQANHRKHVFRTYGTYALPVGPNKLLFKNASGIWGRVVEGWQASWIVNLQSGSPANVLAQSMLYGLGVPDIVGNFDINRHDFVWAEGKPSGNLFADSSGNPLYSKVPDPQCSNPAYVVPSLAGLCTLSAIKDSSGKVVLQTPLPGTRGNFGQARFENLGTWSADMAVQKQVKISESRSMTVRLDASNIFNHPTPSLGGGFFAATAGAPDLDLQSAVPFATLNNKQGSRRFQLKARLDF